MAVKAKLSVFPSFQPSRAKTPMSFVISCSRLSPNPYFRVPLRRVAVTSGSVAAQFRLANRLGIGACIGVILVVQHADGAGVLAGIA